MKLFISADIEGCAGTTFSREVRREDPAYAAFARQMTEETAAVCRAAQKAGAGEIVVKDGHGDGGNIDISALPEGVTLIRGKSGHPINMMFGLDGTFDAVLYIGYHAPAGDGGNPLSHTSTGNSNHILLNGKRMSEFMLNSYTAAMFGVPAVFLSGDERICELAREMVPSITTVSTKKGVGGCAFHKTPSAVLRELETAVTGLFTGTPEQIRQRFSACRLPLPETFVYEVNMKDLKRAYQMSFYPGMKQVDERTLRMESRDWMEIVTAHSFVVY